MKNQSTKSGVAIKRPKNRQTIIFEVIVYTLAIAFWVQFLKHL
jgi:hypothetical protein